MVLVADVGNTNAVVGISEQDQWIAHWRISTNYKRTVDEYTVTLHQLISMQNIDPTGVKTIVLSSVVPNLTGVFQDVLQRLFDAPILLVTNTIETGLVASSIPAELGGDLLANAAAAHHLVKKPVMVIDFGTALTFITVSADGVLLGASIAPGLNSAIKALSTGTAQLPQVDLHEPPSVLGVNTETAIQSGVLYGYAGLVQSIIERTEAEIGEKLFVIATGGLSRIALPVIKRIDHADPWHTLIGLRLFASLNT